jgi:hypothetical protein
MQAAGPQPWGQLQVPGAGQRRLACISWVTSQASAATAGGDPSGRLPITRAPQRIGWKK